jgi:hypothetical protein
VSERTARSTKIVEDFRGTNQVIDEFKLSDEYVPWNRGGYFNEKAEFERIRGKHLNSSITTGGHILTLRQLEFTDSNVLFVHQSSSWLLEDDLTELMSEPSVTPLTPQEPFIF